MQTYPGLAKVAGIARVKNVTSVRYRGYGCPGALRFEDSNAGVTGDLTFSQAWCDPNNPWRLPWRCKLCADSIGLGADLVALDIWPNGNPLHLYPEGEDPGFNWVLTRTPQGEALLQEALSDGRLTNTMKTVTWSMVDNAQPQHVNRRGAAWARLLALWLLGVPFPEYGRGVPTFAAAWKMGFAFCWKEFKGTLLRGRKRNPEENQEWDWNADDEEVKTWGNYTPVLGKP